MIARHIYSWKDGALQDLRLDRNNFPAPGSDDVAMHRFEYAVHTHRREVGELSVDDFGDAWERTQTAMLGGEFSCGRQRARPRGSPS